MPRSQFDVLAFRRRATSLVEVLVVLGIVSILIALLLPAIQRVRAAYDSVACRSNLRQIGIALSLYHHDYGIFPEGCLSEANPAMPFSSWCLRLSPYLEQGDRLSRAIEAYKQSKNFLDIPPHDVATEVFRAFLCPAEPRQREENEGRYGFTHYQGVCGTNYRKNDGMLYVDSRTRYSSVRDGASNTLFVGERPPSLDGTFGWWYAGWGQNKTGSVDMVLGVHEENARDDPHTLLCFRGPYRFQPGGTRCDFFHFWSWHPGGAHFLFVDGSVRMLRYSADSILDGLATRNGGEAVSFDP